MADRREYMRAYMRAYKGISVHACEWCGGGEVAGQRKFCSRKCAIAAQVSRAAGEAVRRTRSCRTCGSEWCRVPWVTKSRNFCSDSCADLSTRTSRFPGFSGADLFQLLGSQRGCCAACGNPFENKASGDGRSDWFIDHDHATGRVRGLLHHQCNTALGMARDDPEELFAWASYLARHTLDLRDLCVR